MTPHPSLIGRTVLIPGGRRGIGRSFALALALARAGAQVAVCGRNIESLDRVQIDLRAHGAVGPLAVVGDVSKCADSERMVERVPVTMVCRGADGQLLPVTVMDQALCYGWCPTHRVA